ncbi:drug/metabolite transporter (DMT)-like permease [Priestia taiwanensis]|uniref:Transporter n=2 Tax=Priestia taiwanensis TaxID=1347902 RepID=A0A917AJ34_9BACI|nr:drug/metabolite transporter (DMT)-like permease [Priestia taiwanensis]GGE55994.1 transporter [Priestia taiwanensis]
MERLKGIMMVIIGASFWGLSGAVAQMLFEETTITAGWLVTIRLLVSGALLLLFTLCTSNRGEVFGVWKKPKFFVHILLFGIFGMVGIQYCYFVSIETGNAAVATLLQYLAPVFIAIYATVKFRELPDTNKVISIAIAVLGTFLLLTDGSIDNLTVSPVSMFWGVLSGVALAFYSLYSKELRQHYSASVLVGWGMIVGGIGMCFVHSPFDVQGVAWTLPTLSKVFFVVIFGTLLAFYLYMLSMKYLTAQEASLLGCTEPLVAILASIVLINIPFGYYQMLGALCVIVMVVMMGRKPASQKVQGSMRSKEAV